jgi:glycerol-3-phosphate dehydrogenase (NAD(P)+)
MKITILGKGVFGSAVASYLTKRGHSVVFDAADSSELIFVCVTSNLVLPSLLKLQKNITNQKIIICSKGFAKDGKLISQVLKEEFENKNEIFYLCGPTLAEELEKGVLSGMVLAGGEGKEEIKKEIKSESLYIELSDDIIGVEISATLKNIMAIFVGMVQGAEYGQNTKALIFTKAVEEIKNVGLLLGAKAETFLGLSCVGDLSLLSRNRLLGVELGKGRKLDDIIKETNYTPCGVFAIKDAKIMLEKLKINAPMIKSLYGIMFENYPIKDAIKEVTNIKFQ